MNEDFFASLTPKTVLQSLYRQRRKALGMIAALILMAFAALMVIPKKYDSEGKIFVSLGRGGVTLDPTATTGKTIMVQETRESEINSITDIITSRGIMEKVINHPEIGPDRVLETSFILSKIPMPNLPSFGGDEPSEEYERLKKMDMAIQKLQKSVDTFVPRKASTISIFCKSESPEFSQLIVETIMDTYIEQHVKARQTEGSFDFFESQFRQQEAMLKDASKRLSQFKNEIGVMSINARRDTLRDRITTIEKSLIGAGSSLASAKSRIERSEQLVDDIPDQLVLEETDGIAQHATDLMRNRLYELELEEKQLLATYTPEHPAVVAVRNQVAQAKEIMSKQVDDRTVTKKGINKNRQQFTMTMMNSEVESSGVEAEKRSLEEKLKLANEEMRKLNRDEIRLAELNREVEIAERNYRAYAEKLEEARINIELDQKNISNVKIVQPATLQVKHVSPRRGLLLVLVAFFSTFAAGCYSIVADRLSGTLNAPEDIVEVLKLDLLATVPVVHQQPDPMLIGHEDN